jgi:hypothetical protein
LHAAIANIEAGQDDEVQDGRPEMIG